MSRTLECLGKEIFEYITPKTIAIKGDPKETLPLYANEIDAKLVVMGAVARIGIAGLIIGNTAENTLYRLNQSVLAIKPKGFKTSTK